MSLGIVVPNTSRVTAKAEERILFFRRWLANPLRVGSVIPSSAALAQLVASHIQRGGDDYILELGAGTGAITRGLLAGGLPEDRLLLVELDPKMSAVLSREFPGVQIITGDATKLTEIVPGHICGRIGTVISGLPVLGRPLEFQQAIVDAAFAVVRPGGAMLQYTYAPMSPLPRRRLGLTGKLLGWAANNLPPAAVWRFTRAEAGA
jgi:phosphatidylethanolamine/phosphatidyl-N-methylethanolamine N-methyltransferase